VNKEHPDHREPIDYIVIGLRLKWDQT